jgi:hypothetical protein
MRQSGSFLVAFSFICCLLTITTNAQEQSLQPGTPVERQLGPNETQSFTITLTENQFVQLVVDQRGIDVVVRVTAPDGKSLGEFDSPNGDNGPENVSFVAVTAGTYHIAVAPLDRNGNIPGGKFEIRIVELRQATDQELNTTKNLEVVKAKGLDLLGEIEGLIPDIHSPYTRIQAQLQLAQLLWSTDDKRAAKFLNDAMMGVKEFLADTTDANTDAYMRTYGAVTQLRWEILRVLSEHDPEAALSFLHSTKLPPNPYGNDRDQLDQERNMELTIANQIAANDPKRAFQVARQILKSGYSGDLMQTLSMLRSKDPELATQLATEIANKLLNEKLLKTPQAGNVAMNLIAACNMRPAKVQRQNRAPVEPLLSEQTCRDLLQKAAQEALSFRLPPNNAYTPERDAAQNLLGGLQSLGQDLDTNVDGGVAAIQKKLAELNNAANPYQEAFQALQTKVESGNADAALESIQKAPEEIRDQLYNQLASNLAAKGDSARARQILNDYVKNPNERRNALRNIEQQDMYRAVGSGRVEEALRTIAALKTPRERAQMLSQVIRQIGPGQKRANAVNLLEQARSLLAPGVQAQDQEQMFVMLELARAFSRYDMKRAFEIIDPLVDQLNEICAAARTLDGFGMDFYQDDELDLQNGNSVANLVVQTSSALGSMAIVNFERAKSTTERLRQPEVRLRVYLEIAQQTIQAAK